MAKISDAIDVHVSATPSPALEAMIRRIIRDELRRLATELSTTAMRNRSEVEFEVQPYKEHVEQRAWFMDELADVVQAAAKKSEMED